MSIPTQALKYGWVALATLTIGTATIFVAPSVLRRITLKDRIEVTLAVVERCYATQTGTNGAGEPVYGVDPPSIVRTWTDTDGSSISMTNAIAWRDDLSMKIELDAKLIALCPYYVNTNSVYDGTTNIIMHTFTGLLTSLDLGDHTNFTAIPAIGTNAATYGPWGWRNYLVAWQERYKMLNALEMSRDYRALSTNGSKQGRSGSFSFYRDLIGNTWSNKTDGSTIEAYNPYSQAYALSLENEYYYATDTNYVNLGGSLYHKMSYGEFQTYATWLYVHHTALSVPPWTDYTNGYTAPTNLTGLGAGGYTIVSKSPYVAISNVVSAWYWDNQFGIEHSTWIFNQQYPDQQITNTAKIYLKPTLPSLPTEISTSGSWNYPRTWNVTVDGRLEELAGMTTNIYNELNSAYISVADGVWTIEFGSDEFSALTTAGSLQTFPGAPIEGASFSDNSGSIGTARGSYLPADNYYFIKTWTFNYCTNKYW